MLFTARIGFATAAGAGAGRSAAREAPWLISSLLRRDVFLLRVLRRRLLDQPADELRIVRGDPVLAHDLELLAVPLHHVELAGTLVIGAGELVGREHAVDA